MMKEGEGGKEMVEEKEEKGEEEEKEEERIWRRRIREMSKRRKKNCFSARNIHVNQGYILLFVSLNKIRNTTVSE